MLVLQQIKVLPAGARIEITDCGKSVMEILKANSDESLIFNSAKESELYYKVYSTFRCCELKAFTFVGISDVKYYIEVREK